MFWYSRAYVVFWCSRASVVFWCSLASVVFWYSRACVVFRCSRACVVFWCSRACVVFQCSRTCGGEGVQTRALQCVWITNKQPAGINCRRLHRPSTSRTCKAPPCSQTGNVQRACSHRDSVQLNPLTSRYCRNYPLTNR